MEKNNFVYFICFHDKFLISHHGSENYICQSIDHALLLAKIMITKYNLNSFQWCEEITRIEKEKTILGRNIIASDEKQGQIVFIERKILYSFDQIPDPLIHGLN